MINNNKKAKAPQFLIFLVFVIFILIFIFSTGLISGFNFTGALAKIPFWFWLLLVFLFIVSRGKKR